MATDIMIADRFAAPVTTEFLDALSLLDGRGVDLGKCVRARLGVDFWLEHRQVLEAGGFVEVWPSNHSGRRVLNAE